MYVMPYEIILGKFAYPIFVVTVLFAFSDEFNDQIVQV